MENKIIKIIATILINFSINNTCIAQSIQLSNTKWIYYLDDCQEVIEFIGESNYQKNSCEFGGIKYGKYALNGNEVILDQLKGQYDEDFPKDSPHRTNRVKYKLLIIGNKMHFIEKWDLNIWGKWEKDDFKFAEEYVFEKVEK